MRSNGYHLAEQQGVAYILLGDGHDAIVDLADLGRTREGHWHLTRAGGRLRVRGMVAGKKVLLHHHLLGVAAGIRVRHLDGNCLDCRRANLLVLPRRPKPTPRTSATGIRNVYHEQRGGRAYYTVTVRRRDRRRSATFPDTSEGRERAERQAVEWRRDIDAPPLYAPAGGPRARRKSGALGAPGLSIWREPRSGIRYYRFSCQRPACRVWRCFPYTAEGLIRARLYAQDHFGATGQAVAPSGLIDEVAEFLARRPSPGEIAAFRLSDAAQARVSDLVERDRGSALTAEERRQLDELLLLTQLVAAIRAHILSDERTAIMAASRP
jgi:hypothetical protein